LTNCINCLLFLSQKFSSSKISPTFFSSLFFFFSLFFFLLCICSSRTVPSWRALAYKHQNKHLPTVNPSHDLLAPQRKHAPLSCSSPLPYFPSRESSPWPVRELKSGIGRPSGESSNQVRFCSEDDPNGVTRSPFCYSRPQFYPKPTLISEICGISFFK
jgi:hypothetical protein